MQELGDGGNSNSAVPVAVVFPPSDTPSVTPSASSSISVTPSTTPSVTPSVTDSITSTTSATRTSTVTATGSETATPTPSVTREVLTGTSGSAPTSLYLAVGISVPIAVIFVLGCYFRYFRVRRKDAQSAHITSPTGSKVSAVDVEVVVSPQLVKEEAGMSTGSGNSSATAGAPGLIMVCDMGVVPLPSILGCESLMLGTQVTPTSPSAKLLPIIPTSAVTKLSPIGQGFFGAVFRGIYNHSAVAVKKTKAQHADSASIEKERAMLSSVPPHPNVIRVIAICVDEAEGSVGIVTEFCEAGSVLSYLHRLPKVLRGEI